MKALISPNEKVYLYDGTVGQRVAEVVQDTQTFPVAEPLFWTLCADDVIADEFYWTGTQILPIPAAPIPEPTPTPTN